MKEKVYALIVSSELQDKVTFLRLISKYGEKEGIEIQMKVRIPKEDKTAYLDVRPNTALWNNLLCALSDDIDELLEGIHSELNEDSQS